MSYKDDLTRYKRIAFEKLPDVEFTVFSDKDIWEFNDD